MSKLRWWFWKRRRFNASWWMWGSHNMFISTYWHLLLGRRIPFTLMEPYQAIHEVYSEHTVH